MGIPRKSVRDYYRRKFAERAPYKYYNIRELPDIRLVYFTDAKLQ
jgi:hypothetical protein